MNGKFVEKYGKAWVDMDLDMKLMVVVSEFFDMRDKNARDMKELKDDVAENRKVVMANFDEFKEECELARKEYEQVHFNKRDLAFIKWIGGAVALALIGAIVALLFQGVF